MLDRAGRIAICGTLLLAVACSKKKESAESPSKASEAERTASAQESQPTPPGMPAPTTQAPSAAGDPALCGRLKSKCPSEPPMKASDVAACNEQVGDPSCGALAGAYFTCIFANEQCKPDGKSDHGTSGACTAQLTAMQTCQDQENAATPGGPRR